MKTAFYNTFKPKGKEDKETVYRAIQFHVDNTNPILTLCKGVDKQQPIMYNGDWIVEHPTEKTAEGGIVYKLYTEEGFKETFTPVEVDPWILSGGRDLSKCSTQ